MTERFHHSIVGFVNLESTTDPKQHLRARLMRATWFDSVTSFLLACVLLLTVITSVLFVIWMYNDRDPLDHIQVPPVRWTSVSGGALSDDDFAIPSSREVSELKPLPFEKRLDALSTAVVMVAEQTDTDGSFDDSLHPGSTPGHTGQSGDELQVGKDIVPRFERWQLKFVASSIEQYAAQLDFYDIELGAIGGDVSGVDCARGWSDLITTRRITDTASEKRLYFLWTHPSPLERFDRELLGRAEIKTTGRKILKFLPFNLENQLALIELRHAQANDVSEVTRIASTDFQSKLVDGGFAFEVIGQRYRPAGDEQ